jgi:hypothetical protein
MRKQLFALAMIASLCMSAPVAVLAQSPAPAASTAPAKAPATHTAPVDTGKTMKSVLAKISLTPDEKSKTDAILANASLKGAARRDAVRKVLTQEHQAQFDSLWKSAHPHKKGKGGATAPSASPSTAPSK